MRKEQARRYNRVAPWPVLPSCLGPQRSETPHSDRPHSVTVTARTDVTERLVVTGLSPVSPTPAYKAVFDCAYGMNANPAQKKNFELESARCRVV